MSNASHYSAGFAAAIREVKEFRTKYEAAKSAGKQVAPFEECFAKYLEDAGQAGQHTYKSVEIFNNRFATL